MSSVLRRACFVKQPLRGFVKLKQFYFSSLDDGRSLCKEESISSDVIDMAVEYLTRLSLGDVPQDVFQMARQGADLLEKYGYSDVKSQVASMVERCRDLTDNSIVGVCRLASLDSYVHSAPPEMMYHWLTKLRPDEDTIYNIRLMVQRSVNFWQAHGMYRKSGFVFDDNGSIRTVYTGNGLYLTNDTLWDFDVSSKLPDKVAIMSLLMQFMMGHVRHQELFSGVVCIGFFNPRLSTVYTLPVDEINQKLLNSIECDILYG